MSKQPSEGKLTKKQQKALKHRTGVRSGKAKEIEQLAIPEQDLVDEEGPEAAVKGKGKKRKRGKEDEGEEESEREGDNVKTTTPKRKSNKDRKQRFIVFVGMHNPTLRVELHTD